MLEYADHHAGATLFFRAATFDADFHAILLKMMIGSEQSKPVMANVCPSYSLTRP
jgi:hypothetical protein